MKLLAEAVVSARHNAMRAGVAENGKENQKPVKDTLLL